MNAIIITIGDELLIGQVVDTNSAWMAIQLNKAGIKVIRRVAVGDVKEDIIKCLEEEKKHAPILLLTGGLGPTTDDITKPLLCEYFGGKMIVDEIALQNVKYLFEVVFKRPMLERNLKQAEVPDVCTVIQNKRGTAPGMIFHKDECVFVSMPGVPHEMKGMMEDTVLPMLIKAFKVVPVVHRTLMTFGMGESFLAERLIEFENNLPPGIKLAYLPHFGLLRLRLSGSSNNINFENILEEHFTQLQFLLNDVMISDRDETMQELIARLLIHKNKTIATAESCTGGFISHLLTSVPGASAYYNGSVVSYSNPAKEDILGVDQQLVTLHGAVSEPVVKAMVQGVIKIMHTDYAIAVSGIMGPDGGTAEKPVGTVWIAVGSLHNIVAKKLHFRFERKINIEVTAMNALNMLREHIISEV